MFEFLPGVVPRLEFLDWEESRLEGVIRGAAIRAGIAAPEEAQGAVWGAYSWRAGASDERR